jgi:hypothetical protein
LKALAPNSHILRYQGFGLHHTYCSREKRHNLTHKQEPFLSVQCAVLLSNTAYISYMIMITVYLLMCEQFESRLYWYDYQIVQLLEFTRSSMIVFWVHELWTQRSWLQSVFYNNSVIAETNRDSTAHGFGKKSMNTSLKKCLAHKQRSINVNWIWGCILFLDIYKKLINNSDCKCLIIKLLYENNTNEAC